MSLYGKLASVHMHSSMFPLFKKHLNCVTATLQIAELHRDYRVNRWHHFKVLCIIRKLETTKFTPKLHSRIAAMFLPRGDRSM